MAFARSSESAPASPTRERRTLIDTSVHFSRRLTPLTEAPSASASPFGMRLLEEARQSSPLMRAASRSRQPDSPLSPSVDSTSARYKARDDAARRIQSFLRSRLRRGHGKRMLAMWPSLSRLKELYLDREAVKAGAKDSKWYTNEMIVQREALKNDPMVVAALAEAWTVITSASFSPGGASASLSFESYAAMSRKLYLVLELERAERLKKRVPSVDASECRRAIEDEWAADSGGAERMGRPHFESAWFQLADLHTKAVGAVMYAQWILDKLHKICVTRVPTPGQLPAPTGKGYEWRSDDEIMATAAVKARVAELRDTLEQEYKAYK